jgi:large subunit ribosomal protein L30
MARTFVWHPTRGPRKAPQFKLPASGKVRIKQIRSGIGKPWRQRATLEALGLRHHQDVVIQEITPGLKGQITQVRHLVEVTPVEGGHEQGEQGEPKRSKAKATKAPKEPKESK